MSAGRAAHWGGNESEIEESAEEESFKMRPGAGMVSERVEQQKIKATYLLVYIHTVFNCPVLDVESNRESSILNCTGKMQHVQ